MTAVHKSSEWTRFGGLFITPFYQWKGFCGKMAGSNNERKPKKTSGGDWYVCHFDCGDVVSTVVCICPNSSNYIHYVSLFVYWLYISKAVLKICAHRHIQETYYYKIRKKKVELVKKKMWSCRWKCLLIDLAHKHQVKLSQFWAMVPIVSWLTV